jgi:hypothetical protein
MVDVPCPSCARAWDDFYLRFEVWLEDLGPGLADRAQEILAQNGQPLEDQSIREAMEDAGWLFAGNSVLSFYKCPYCRGISDPKAIDAIKVMDFAFECNENEFLDYLLRG